MALRSQKLITTLKCYVRITQIVFYDHMDGKLLPRKCRMRKLNQIYLHQLTAVAIASLNALELAYKTKMSKSLLSFLHKEEIKDHGSVNSNPKNPFHISKRHTPLPSDCIDLMYSEMG